MLGQLVKRRIKDGGHEVCFGGCAVGVFQAQRPGLLIAWVQVVAEAGPLPTQLVVGLGQTKGAGVLMADAVFHEYEVHGQTVVILLKIRNLNDTQLIGQADELVLDDTVLANQRVVERHILETATHLK